MNLHVNSIPDSSTTFSDRIKMLIQRVGSVTEIARMCGFSEGVVRSWRDGNTDPSRARCVTLARTLGISLVWLVAGEGSMQIDPGSMNHDDSAHSDVVAAQRHRHALRSDILGPGGSDVDAAAMVSFNHRLAERLKGTRSIGRLSS